jgi:chromatin remodeling complex protein RSC6
MDKGKRHTAMTTRDGRSTTKRKRRREEDDEEGDEEKEEKENEEERGKVVKHEQSKNIQIEEIIVSRLMRPCRKTPPLHPKLFFISPRHNYLNQIL